MKGQFLLKGTNVMGPFKTDHSSGEYGKQRGGCDFKARSDKKKRKLHREHTKDPTQTRLKTILFLQDLTTLRWEQPEIRDPKPIGRRSHSALNLDGDLLIFGGYNSSKETHMNDLWLLDVNLWTWRKLQPHGKGPGM